MTESTYKPGILRDQSEGEQAANRVLTWWARLAGDDEWLEKHAVGSAYPPALRATLRRAGTPDEVLLTEAFRHLWFALPSGCRRPNDMLAWACVAAVTAEVKKNTATPFACAMASGTETAPGQPRVSEIRFRRLLQSRDLDELMRLGRRMMHLIDEAVGVVSVADGILQWHREQRGFEARRPSGRLAVRWASDYYSQLEVTEKTTAASTR